MNDRGEPFDSVDGAHEYVTLLYAALAETRAALAEDARRAEDEGAARRLDALRLVGYKLDRLERHLDASRRLLNDLRTLRRLLLGERGGKPAAKG
jgi:hypothetical protein